MWRDSPKGRAWTKTYNKARLTANLRKESQAIEDRVLIAQEFGYEQGFWRGLKTRRLQEAEKRWHAFYRHTSNELQRKAADLTLREEDRVAMDRTRTKDSAAEMHQATMRALTTIDSTCHCECAGRGAGRTVAVPVFQITRSASRGHK